MTGMNPTCSFSESSLSDLANFTCSSEILPIDTFDTEEQSIFLTSCGIPPGTGFLLYKNICSHHINAFRNAYKKRCMKRLCSVPTAICCHSGKNCKTERYVTAAQVSVILQNTGVILPVGTGLCVKCRKSLLKQAQDRDGYTANNSKNIQDDRLSLLEPEMHISDQEMAEDLHGSKPSVEPEPDCVEVYTWMSSGRKRKAKEVTESPLLSQETSQSMSQETDHTLTQVSEASTCMIEKLDKLNEFIAMSGLSPVKKIQGPLKDASARTIQRYKLKARQCINSVLETICPGEGSFLESQLFPEPAIDSTIATLLEIYSKADTWMFRRQVLSILTEQLNYDALRRMIPNLTQWHFYEAKKHADSSGAGQPVQYTKHKREKFEAKSLEHFIDFITSNQIIKDLPFGEKTLKLSTGEVRNIPNVVRSIAPVSIIKQYLQLCEEDEIKPLGTSTLYKLLDECAASVRKSMEGLDNYITEGGRAFVELEKLLNELPGETQEIKKKTPGCKAILKIRYESKNKGILN